jgi:hypothetical protein
MWFPVSRDDKRQAGKSYRLGDKSSSSAFRIAEELLPQMKTDEHR